MILRTLSLLAISLAITTTATAATQQVKLPKALQSSLAAINAQLKSKLSSDDYAEVLKGEMVWEGDTNSLRTNLEKILKNPENDEVFPRAYIVKEEGEGICFQKHLQNQVEPILYADKQWVISRANGKGKNSSVYTFWNAMTGYPEMSLNLPGSVYCPVATNLPGVYALVLTTSRRSSEDTYTWHGYPCAICYVKPADNSFATWYISGADSSHQSPNPNTYYKGLKMPETPYFMSVAQSLMQLERTGNKSIADQLKARKEIQAKYEAVGRQYDTAAALTQLGRSAHLMAPVQVEHTISYRLPSENELRISGDMSGKTAALTYSADGMRYVSLDFNSLSRTVSYMPQAINKTVSYSAEGKPEIGLQEKAVDALKRKLTPMPARVTSGIQGYTKLDKIEATDPQVGAGNSLFVCSAGNYAWNVYDGAIVDELLGISRSNGTLYFFNPTPVEVGAVAKMHEYSEVVNRGDRGLIRGGSGAVQFAGKYRLLSILSADSESIRVLLCKQIAQNKEQYTLCSIHPGKPEFTVLKKWDAPVHRLAPVWIAAKKWLLQPVSSDSYEVVKLQDDNQMEKVATLYLSPQTDGYAVVLPNGLYAGSPGCERFLNMTANGKTMSLSVYAPWKNRPAEVLRQLGGNADDEAALRETTRRWLSKQGLDMDNMPEEPTPADLPMVKAPLPPLHTQQQTLSLNVQLQAGANALKTLKLFTDGTLQPTPKIAVAAGKSGNAKLNIPLAPGVNNIEIIPVDERGIAGSPLKFRTVCTAKAGDGDLYVVAMGVSKYDDEEINLQYAAKDATDISEAFRRYGMGNKKHILLLTDKQVKDESVLEQVQAFLKPARKHDRVVLYIAGHGMLDDKLQYFYAPAAFNVEDIAGTGISMDSFRECLQSCSARYKLMLLDTCHAGSLGEAGQDSLAASGVPLPHGVQAVQTRGMKVKKAKKPEEEKLTDNQKKRYIEDFFTMDEQMRGINVLAASAGAEFAQESGKWKNGVFTSSLIRTLSRDAAVDTNADGLLSVEEMLHYVSADVSTLTAHTQKPSVVSAEDTRTFHLSTDLAYFVLNRDWEGLKTAAKAGFRVNESAYPDTEAIVCKSLENGIPEDALVCLLENGANINRARKAILRGEHLQEVMMTPRMIITQDNAYIDFDGRKVDFCTKYGYPVLQLRRLLQPYYAKHKQQFESAATPAAPTGTAAPAADNKPTTPTDSKTKKAPKKRIRSRLYK